MKNLIRKPVAVHISNPITRQGSKYQNIGYLIRMGLYDGVSDDASTLLRNQYDSEIGDVDPMFRYGDSSVGVDKFERSVITARRKASADVDPSTQVTPDTSSSDTNIETDVQ